jgi:hypothetical protein
LARFLTYLETAEHWGANMQKRRLPRITDDLGHNNEWQM